MAPTRRESDRQRQTTKSRTSATTNAEDAQTFGERRADEGARELAVSRRRVAQRAREEVAEDGADADGGRPMPSEARPAPMNLAATGSMVLSPVWNFMTGWDELSRALPLASVAGVQRVVEIDAGQDREDIGLQESDEELHRSQRNRQQQRQRRDDGRSATRGDERDDEAAEDLERDMAGQHVAEQTKRQAKPGATGRTRSRSAR